MIDSLCLRASVFVHLLFSLCPCPSVFKFTFITSLYLRVSVFKFILITQVIISLCYE